MTLTFKLFLWSLYYWVTSVFDHMPKISLRNFQKIFVCLQGTQPLKFCAPIKTECALNKKNWLLSRAKRVTLYFRSFIFNGIPQRRFQGVTLPPKWIYISKKQLCSNEATSTNGAQFQLYLNICPRDFSIIIYYFSVCCRLYFSV